MVSRLVSRAARVYRVIYLMVQALNKSGHGEQRSPLSSLGTRRTSLSHRLSWTQGDMSSSLIHEILLQEISWLREDDMSLKAPNLSLQGAGSHVLPPGISHGDIRVSAASNISGVLKDISMSYRHQRRRRPRQRSLTICAGGPPSIHGTTSSSAAGAYSEPTDIHSLLVNKPSSSSSSSSSSFLSQATA